MMWTELHAYLKHCDLTYDDFAKLMGIPANEVHDLGRTKPVPRIAIAFLRLFDHDTHMMKGREEKLAYFRGAWQEFILEPHEILNVERDDLVAGAASKSELVRFYAAQGNEKAVRKAANAFEQMCDFAHIFQDEKL